MGSVKSILVVEEEYALRHTLSLILQRAGYQVTAVAEPWQIFVEFNNNLYDLLFIDVQTSEKKLASIIDEIRQDAPETRLLLLTPFDYPLPSGSDIVCLIKPVAPEQVLHAIQNESDF